MGVSYGLIHQPVVGEQTCGDTYLLLDRGTFVLVAVVDGLGHGPAAEEAAQKAVAYIEAHATQPPQQLLEGCHRALRGTRGAVLAIARIERENGKLIHSGLGNIETRVVTAEKVYHPVTVHGIVGHQARKFRSEEIPFQPGDLLLMHSDGISDRFELSTKARGRDLQLLASQIAHEHGRHHDDQLLLIVRDDA